MKMMHLFKAAICFLLLGQMVGCSSAEGEPNTLSEQEQKEGWTLLFDGKSFDKWHIYNAGSPAGSAWQIRNGEIYCDPDNESQKGDLVTNEEFENYELKFQWKLMKEGNSGVFINVLETSDLNATWHSGPEYQLLDDAHADYDVFAKRSGCLYTFAPQKNLANNKVRTEWNNSRIVQKDGKVQFYLNDILTAEMDFKSKAWFDKIEKSHFRDFPEFGKHTKGKIALQDWSRGVSFRNIKIKTL